MITTHTTFFGIPLESRRKRRLIALGYYAFVALFPSLIFSGAHWLAGALISQTFILGSLLGGIKPRGPVKPFEGSDSDGLPDTTLTLDLNGRRKSRVTFLDEREQHQRDHAHYLAYKILRVLLALVAAAYWLLSDFNPPWLLHRTPILVWTLLIVVLSLPHAVLLWTEPDAIPEGALTLVPANPAP